MAQARAGDSGFPERLADARTAERQWRRRTPVAAGQLRLVGNAAMLDAVGEARIGGLTAEMEIGLARVADRPAANTVVQVQQAGLVGDVGAWLGRNQAARRCRRDWGLGVAGTLADKAAGTDRTILERGVGRLRALGLRRSWRKIRAWTVRRNASACQLRRVISTRFVAKAATMQAAGWTSEKIIGQLVCGWTPDERSKVG